ncbi:MAG TPA: hypothetical protein VHM94_10040, partial [Acidimicrobiia bacterium]|nr:hypothetical protein [Acidimicrobiia bacterium]
NIPNEVDRPRAEEAARLHGALGHHQLEARRRNPRQTRRHRDVMGNAGIRGHQQEDVRPSQNAYQRAERAGPEGNLLAEGFDRRPWGALGLDR